MTDSKEALSRCEVVGATKSVGASGGGGSICTEVERAIALRAPGVRYGARIRVLSPSRLAATLTVDGRTLPEQNFAVTDGKLSDRSLKHFAESLAAAVAEAAAR